MGKKDILPDNPFFTGINIPDKFFCDRKKETDKIVASIRNGDNIVLKSPRRIGKSSLLKHVFLQDEIARKYNTLYVDIFGTKCAADFISEFQNAFLSAPFARGEKGRREILALFKGVYVELTSTMSGTIGGAKVGFSSDSEVRLTLQEMFRYLESTKKPNLVVFDEFQQIHYYPERMAAILRSHVQQMNNCRFVFSGSSRHLLSRMFDSASEPFFKSALSMDLDIISFDSYLEFCESMFRMYGKEIDEDAVSLVYNLFCGNTFEIQQVMRTVFSSTKTGEKADRNIVISRIKDIIEDRDNDFREILNRLDNRKERNTLFCIATEGLASGLTSSAMMRRYNLDNASSVQNALRNLSSDKMNLIVKIGKSHYKLQDKFFELWIACQNRFFDSKIDSAKELFDKERALQSLSLL